MEIVIIWLVVATIVGFAAHARGRSWVGWVLLSVLISPLLGLILVLVLRNVRRESEESAARIARQLEDEKRQQREHERRLESIRVMAPAPAAMSATDELLKLAALREKGLLTEDEFATQKARVLAR